MRRHLRAGIVASLLAFAPGLSASWPHHAKQVEKQLQSSSLSERQAALKGLAELSPSVAREPLLIALQDVDPGIQKGAAQLAELFALSGFAPVVSDWFGSRDADKRLLAVALTWREPTIDNQRRLARLLRDPERRIREASARALGRQPQPLAIEAQRALVTALDDAEEPVRIQAVIALGRVGEAGSALALAAHLQDTAWEVRVQLALALGLLENAAVVPSLLLSLSDPQPEVRAAAAEALGRLGQEQALPGLVALVESTPFEAPQKRAAEALALLGSPEAIDTLVRQLSRDGARPYVSRILTGLSAPDSRALEACLKVAVGAELTACLQLHEAQGGDSQAALAALDEGRISLEQAFRFPVLKRETLLIPALETLDSGGAQGSDWALSYLEKNLPLPAQAARPLSDSLAGAGGNVERTRRILDVLAHTLPGAPLEPLFAYLESTEPGIRKVAAQALVAQGLAGARLERLLLDNRPGVSQGAFAVLAVLQSKAQAEVVLSLLQRADTGRRSHLLRALAALPPGLPDSRFEVVEKEVYLSRAGERDEWLLAFARNGSAERLKRIAQRGNRADRLKLAQLAFFHPEGVEVAEALLSRDEPRVSSLALFVLGTRGSPASVESVLPYLERSGHSPLYLQAAAYQALAQLSGRGVTVPSDVSLAHCASNYWPLKLRSMALAVSQGRSCPSTKVEDILLLSENGRLRLGAARLLSGNESAIQSLQRCATYETDAKIAAICRDGVRDRGEPSEGELPYLEVEFFTPWARGAAPLTPAPVEYEDDVVVLFSDRQGLLLLPWAARATADPAWAY